MADTPELEERIHLTPAELAEAFRTAANDAGVYVESGLTAEQEQTYWYSQAVNYHGIDWDGQSANIQKFISDNDLSEGRKSTQKYNNIGSLMLSNENGIIHYNGDVAFTATDIDGVMWATTVDYSESVEYGTAWSAPTVWGGNFRWEMMSLGTNEKEYDDLFTLNPYRSIFWNGTFPDDDYAVLQSDYYFSVGSDDYLYLNARSSVERRYLKNLTYDAKPGYDTLYAPGDGSYYAFRTHLKNLVVSEMDVTLSMDGGGGGGDGSSTLVFTAMAGLSGRHCDPMHGATVPNHPIPRNEIPAYGSGGYGGHGGGGGAGASTVVIYKFNSGKADSVEQVAISQRHGYGSGGGAGGKGGDGCILIFW